MKTESLFEPVFLCIQNLMEPSSQLLVSILQLPKTRVSDSSQINPCSEKLLRIMVVRAKGLNETILDRTL